METYDFDLYEALDIGRLTLSWLAEPSASTSPLGPHAPQVMPSLSLPAKCLPG